MKRCCFTLSLGNGCILIAAVCIISIIFTCIKYVIVKGTIPVTREDTELQEKYMIACVFDLFILWPANIFLLRGTNQKRPLYLLAWIFTYAIQVIVYLLIAAYGFYTIFAEKENGIPFFGRALFSLPFTIYFLAVVYSHYVELKEGRLVGSFVMPTTVSYIHHSSENPLTITHPVSAPIASLSSSTSPPLQYVLDIQPPPYHQLFPDKPMEPPPCYSELDKNRYRSSNYSSHTI